MMKIMGSYRFQFPKKIFPLLLLIASSPAGAESTIETNLAERIKDSEFNALWGLGAIGADYAYAAGYTGKGIAIGVLDEAVFFHPEFNGKLQVFSLENENFNYSDYPDGTLEIGTHGTHVAGIAAAKRDGIGMHGVAYDADIIAAKYLQTSVDHSEQIINSKARIINNSWGPSPDINTDSNGNPIKRPNGTWDYEQVTLQDNIDTYGPYLPDIEAMSRSPIPFKYNYANSAPAMLRAARANKLIVFAAGNENNYNVPLGESSLPYFFPDILSHYLVVTNLTPQNELAASSTSCGYAASYCISAPGTDILSTAGWLISPDGGPITQQALDNDELALQYGYMTMSGTSMAAPVVSGAAAVLMQRFPYMTTAQIAAVLKTTATDLGEPGLDARYGWGKLNLRAAINGPGMFVTQEDIPSAFYIDGSYQDRLFIANIPGYGAIVEANTPAARTCNSVECAYDIWSNAISGHGGLLKTGKGTLELTGNSNYHGPTLVNQGTLAINGGITSHVTVQSGGTLQGNGSIGALSVLAGGRIAPKSDATLHVAQNINFEPGSRYRVAVSRAGHSSRPESAGAAAINGGDVAISLDNSANLLSFEDVQSLSHRSFTILSARQGISGHFSAVLPYYLFIGAGLAYTPEIITVNIGRNATPFAFVAATKNERAVASAADKLPAGHPVYESILMNSSTAAARRAFSQLSGELHAATASALLDNAGIVRDTLNARLRHRQSLSDASEVRENDGGAWVQITGDKNHVSGTHNASGFKSSTSGILLGIDTGEKENGYLGLATGYTHSVIRSGQRGHAKSDNYHAGIYAGKRLDNVLLRAGIANTWHRIDTTRSVNYAAQADSLAAGYSASTHQLFVETGYAPDADRSSLEPFARLAWADFVSQSVHERGGSAALRAGKQSMETTLSTIGVRAGRQWSYDKGRSLALHGELGWQHRYNSLRRDKTLNFTQATSPFTVDSVAAARDGARLAIEALTTLGTRASVSLSYHSGFSARHQSNALQAGVQLQF